MTVGDGGRSKVHNKIRRDRLFTNRPPMIRNPLFRFSGCGFPALRLSRYARES
jgi:hypothetical protein